MLSFRCSLTLRYGSDHVNGPNGCSLPDDDSPCRRVVMCPTESNSYQNLQVNRQLKSVDQLEKESLASSMLLLWNMYLCLVSFFQLR